LYSPYQKPKKCWKCGGFKVWSPQYNKWICPQCYKPTQAYPSPAYPQSAYPQSAYPQQYGYTPQYNYPQRPYSTPQRPYPTYSGTSPMYRRPSYPAYQTPQLYLPASPIGNKLCIYCGATMKEDELICPKCMQRALLV
jgi:hypothetical protein